MSAPQDGALARSIQAAAGLLPATPDLAPLEHRVRNLEGLVRPVERCARLANLLGAERRAMGFFGALPVWRAKADHGAACDQRGAVAVLRLLDGAPRWLGIVAVDPAWPTSPTP